MSLNVVIVVKGLDAMPKKLRAFRHGILARMERMLKLSGLEIVGIAQDKYLSGPRPERLGIQSGQLRNSVGESVRVSGNTVTVGSNLPYAAIHEYGGVILPRTAQRLVFQVGGQWRSALRVVMPARPYLRPALKDAIPGVKRIIQRLTDEALREAMA